MTLKYLKHSYKLQLWALLAVNVIAFWGVVVADAEFSTLLALMNAISFEDGLIGSITPTIAFVLDGLLSPDAKARIVFWRWRHPLPGSRAFSLHLRNERRADPYQLNRRWGPFPEDPVAQNSLWYQMYQTCKEEIRVREAHRAFLFSRDLAAHTLLFLIFFGTATLFSDAQLNTWGWYLGALMVQYALVMITARTQGIRFVRQVLVIASQAHLEPRGGNP